MTLFVPDYGLRLTNWRGLVDAITNMDQAGVAAGLVTTGSTQATAVAIANSKPLVELTTASAGGAMLPLAAAGKIVLVANNSGNTQTIYTNASEPDATPFINTTAGATGVTQSNGVHAIYFCVASGASNCQWYRILSA